MNFIFVLFFLLSSDLFSKEKNVYEIISGTSIAVAALLLIIPGFFTDSIGFLLLIPFTRKILFSFTFKNRIKKGKENQNQTIEGEIVDKKKDEL